jgi:AbrB family looped-hinge helix DNA binding protein
MSKVTSKLQVSVPKAIADRYQIRPGDEIEWIAAGDTIRVLPAGPRRSADDVSGRLSLYDAATTRQRRRQTRSGRTAPPKARGWTREDLYRRGGAR